MPQYTTLRNTQRKEVLVLNKSSSKNLVRMIIVIFLVAVAAFVAFFVMPRMYEKEEATASIIMLRQNVAAGTRIDSTMVIATEVGAYGLNSGVIKDASQVVGKYAVQPISSKDLLFAEKFSDAPPSGMEEEELPDVELNNGQMLLTLELSSIAAGAAGKIAPGDTVNTAVFTLGNSNGYIYDTNLAYDADGQPISADAVIFPPSLQNLTVYRVQTAQLTSVKQDATVSSSSNNGRIPVYITLIVTQAQADLLLEYSYSNVVHFLETSIDD